MYKDAIELIHLGSPVSGVSSSVMRLVKSFQGNESKYSGTYTEDLDLVLDTYENMALSCGATMV